MLGIKHNTPPSFSAEKSGGVLCLMLKKFECPTVSAFHRYGVTSITLIPFDICS